MQLDFERTNDLLIAVLYRLLDRCVGVVANRSIDEFGLGRLPMLQLAQPAFGDLVITVCLL